ncbi:hypothetical protein TNCV_2922141, partial [Trichonephila clavipes]
MASGVIVHCWDSGLRRQWVCVVLLAGRNSRCSSLTFVGLDTSAPQKRRVVKGQVFGRTLCR